MQSLSAVLCTRVLLHAYFLYFPIYSCSIVRPLLCASCLGFSSLLRCNDFCIANKQDKPASVLLQFSTLALVWPSLLLTYLGQAAYLTKHPENVFNTYYASVPHAVFWPMFVLAVLAAIIASQVCTATAEMYASRSAYSCLVMHDAKLLQLLPITSALAATNVWKGSWAPM